MPLTPTLARPTMTSWLARGQAQGQHALNTLPLVGGYVATSQWAQLKPVPAYGLEKRSRGRLGSSGTRREIRATSRWLMRPQPRAPRSKLYPETQLICSIPLQSASPSRVGQAFSLSPLLSTEGRRGAALFLWEG